MSLAAQLEVDRADRTRVGREGTLRDPARVPVDIVVDNLSRTGCLVKLDAKLARGMLVSIGIPGIGIRFAEISRADRPHYACAFLDPIQDTEIKAALSASTVITRAFDDSDNALQHLTSLDEPPEIVKFPGSVRVAIILGSTAILWTMIIAAFA